METSKLTPATLAYKINRNRETLREAKKTSADYKEAEKNIKLLFAELKKKGCVTAEGGINYAKVRASFINAKKAAKKPVKSAPKKTAKKKAAKKKVAA